MDSTEQSEVRKMDITKISMVRSAKGTDMLCVDDFLYHYDDCSSKSYRWVCNRRKDKQLMCRSRLTTVTIDGDQTKHQVTKVSQEHSHDRCTPQEVFKVRERKRLADLAGAPCTLENKALKRKIQRSGGATPTPSKRRKAVESAGEESEQEDDYDDDDFSWPEEGTVRKSTAAPAVKIKREKRESATAESLFDFASSNLYMLKTPLGRLMLCVKGYLYRLEGKSLTSSTHRWECIKQGDEACKLRILTDRSPQGVHRLKGVQDVKHEHEAFSPWKLTKLLHKNNISLISENGAEQPNAASVRNFEEIIFNAGISSADERPSAAVAKQKGKALKNPTKKYKSDDPLAGKPQPTKYELDKAKLSFLPSAKGNQVLCLDNFLYHYDSRSPHNGRSYWTCVMRRDKIFKCNARVTTQMTDKGPVVARLSGNHNHPDNTKDIKRRLQKHIVLKGIKQEDVAEMVKNTTKQLGKSTKAAMKKSKEAVQQNMRSLRRRVQDGLTRRKYKELDSDTQDSSSSFSSAMNSDNEDNVTLPTKLEEMYEGDAVRTYNDESETTKTEVIFQPESNDFIDEVGMDDQYTEPPCFEQVMEPIFKEGDDLPNAQTTEIKRNDSSSSEDDEMSAYKYGKNMDLSNISKLRSMKGGEMLCVDGYIYHWKSASNNRSYWSCIKYKDPLLKCKGRVATLTNRLGGTEVTKATNFHNHPVDQIEIRRRMCSEILKNDSMSEMRASEVVKMSFSELSETYANLVSNCLSQQWGTQSDDGQNNECNKMKLYSVSDGPPSLAVRMCLKALNIPFELINVDYMSGEHMTEAYAKMNPQKEIPVLDDNGFFLPESIAIMQYLCDKYAPEKNLYPHDPNPRAIVNHRLCFNMGFYYAAISAHSMAPIFFDYPRNEMSLKKVNNALAVFETYLQRGGTKYVAANHLTIADLALVSATLCLEAIGFDLSPYPMVNKWYQTFKEEYPQLWAIANGGMQEIKEFEKNPPDLSGLNHPFHPARKPKV